MTDRVANEASPPAKPRRRRRWYQFRLRTAFFVLTIAGIGLGWYVNRPRLILDGFCPVSLQEKETWVSGSRFYTATYRGTRYHFAGPRERDAFLADPMRYVVAFRGYDVVVAMHDKQLVPGERKHGLWYRGRSYLFRDEKTLRKFYDNPSVYTDFAYHADVKQQGTTSQGDMRSTNTTPPGMAKGDGSRFR